MSLLTVFFIAVGLAADCFAVAVGGSVSLRRISAFQVCRVAAAFGLFQALMPVLGWLAGRTVVDWIAAYDHCVAFGLLVAVGGKMVWESLRLKSSVAKTNDITKGLLLLTLSMATSIDAVASRLELRLPGG